MRAEVSRLSQDNRDMASKLGSQTDSMDKLEALVDKLQDDKKRLSVRVNKLITTGK